MKDEATDRQSCSWKKLELRETGEIIAELRYSIMENMQSHISVVSYFCSVINHKINYVSLIFYFYFTHITVNGIKIQLDFNIKSFTNILSFTSH